MLAMGPVLLAMGWAMSSRRPVAQETELWSMLAQPQSVLVEALEALV